MRADEYEQRAGGRWASMPLYTKSNEREPEGQLRRQCTKEYKIDPVEKKIRERCGDVRRPAAASKGLAPMSLDPGTPIASDPH